MGEVLLLSPLTQIPSLSLMVSLTARIFSVIVLCRKAGLSNKKGHPEAAPRALSLCSSWLLALALLAFVSSKSTSF